MDGSGRTAADGRGPLLLWLVLPALAGAFGKEALPLRWAELGAAVHLMVGGAWMLRARRRDPAAAPATWSPAMMTAATTVYVLLPIFGVLPAWLVWAAFPYLVSSCALGVLAASTESPPDVRWANLLRAAAPLAIELVFFGAWFAAFAPLQARWLRVPEGHVVPPALVHEQHLMFVAFPVLMLVSGLLAHALRRRFREAPPGRREARGEAERLLALVHERAARELGEPPVRLTLRRRFAELSLNGTVDLMLQLAATFVVFTLFVAYPILGARAASEARVSCAILLLAFLICRRHTLAPPIWALALFGTFYGAEALGGAFPRGTCIAVGVLAAILAGAERSRRGRAVLALHGASRTVAYRFPLSGDADPIDFASSAAPHDAVFHVDLAAGPHEDAVRPEPAELDRPVLAFTAAGAAFVWAMTGMVAFYSYSVFSSSTLIAHWARSDLARLETECAVVLAGRPDEPVANALLAAVRCSQRRYPEAQELMTRARSGGPYSGVTGDVLAGAETVVRFRASLPQRARELWRQRDPSAKGFPDEQAFVSRTVAKWFFESLEPRAISSPLFSRETVACAREALRAVPDDAECLFEFAVAAGLHNVVRPDDAELRAEGLAALERLERVATGERLKAKARGLRQGFYKPPAAQPVR